MKLMLDKDPVTRTKSRFHSFADEEFAVETEQDVEPIIEEAKFHRKGSDGHFNMNKPTRVASIPLNLWMKWQKEGITQDDEALKRRLNDPDYRGFRTHPGRL